MVPTTMIIPEQSDDQCHSMSKQREVEARAARKRAKQKARSMLSDIQKDEKARQSSSAHSHSGFRQSRPVSRSKSVDYSYHGLFAEAVVDDEEEARSSQRRSNKRSNSGKNNTLDLYSASRGGRPKTNRTHSDPLLSMTYSSRAKEYTLRTSEMSSSLSLSRGANPSKGRSVAQGPESFLSQNQHSKTTSTAPRKPRRRLSNDGGEEEEEETSVASSSAVMNSQKDQSFSGHDSFVSCPGIIQQSHHSKNGVFSSAPRQPSRTVSSSESSESSLEWLDTGSILSLENEWPTDFSSSAHSVDPTFLGSSGLVSSFNTTESTTPRKPTRRLSIGNGDKAVENAATPPRMNLSAVDLSQLSPRKPTRTPSDSLPIVAIGNESFASIGREYIFEDPHRLFLAGSPQKKKTEKKVSPCPTTDEIAFTLSAQFSFSGNMSSNNSSASLQGSEDSFAVPEVRRCAI